MAGKRRSLAASLAAARLGGLQQVYFWHPTAAELAVWETRGEGMGWEPGAARLFEETVEMLKESLVGEEEGAPSWFELACAVGSRGEMLGFALLDANSDAHGFEMITLGAIPGHGYGSALLASVAQRAGAQDLFLTEDVESEGFYNALGLRRALDWDGGRVWPVAACVSAAADFAASGIANLEGVPGLAAANLAVGALG